MNTKAIPEIEPDAYQIDKARVRASFDRAAQTYDGSAVLQTEVRERMFSRLDLIKIKPDAILDAGCGTGHASLELGKRYSKSQIISLDIATSMLKKTAAQYSAVMRLLGMVKQQAVCADVEQLPIADKTLDMIWSNLAVQWCNDLDLAFTESHRVLKPGGLFMFSTFGPDTLKELRQASSIDADYIHVSRFIDMHDIGDALVRAGYTAPVLDVERFELTYDDVISVMRDLKAIGAHNSAQGRRRGLQGRGFLQKLTQAYEQFRQASGKLPATFEVVYAHAWKAEAKPHFDGGLAPITFRPRS